MFVWVLIQLRQNHASMSCQMWTHMDAAGNATLLSPHDSETNEWIFRSKHTPSGKVLKINVERLLRFVNDRFGVEEIQEVVEE